MDYWDETQRGSIRNSLFDIAQEDLDATLAAAEKVILRAGHAKPEHMHSLPTREWVEIRSTISELARVKLCERGISVQKFFNGAGQFQARPFRTIWIAVCKGPVGPTVSFYNHQSGEYAGNRIIST